MVSTLFWHPFLKLLLQEVSVHGRSSGMLCEHSNETLGSIKDVDFLDQLKKDSAHGVSGAVYRNS